MKPATNKTYESEDMAKKRKMIELKREIEMKRRALMEKYNADIKSQMKKFNEEGLTEEMKKEIERKIADDKTKLNSLIKEEQESKKKEIEEKKQI
jgi:hypothetical protein